VAKLRPKTHCRLEALGRERALIYKTMVLTGLRKLELASLTVSSLELDGPVTYAILDAANEKNRQGSEIPLRADLAEDLRQWLAEKLDAIQDEARRRDGACKKYCVSQ
jgi:integrase